MKYLLMIYDEEKNWEKLSDAEREGVYGQYRSLVDELTASGNFLGGHELHPTSSATSIRFREGKRLVTDGPFAETREQLGGYFLVEAPDLDEAIAIAGRIPTAHTGTIEIRPCNEEGS